MKDGCLFLLDSIYRLGLPDTITGFGIQYDKYRDILSTNVNQSGKRIGSAYRIPVSEVALVETNDLTGMTGEILGITLTGVPTFAVSIYCLINPKACFGSCPTFYAWDGADTSLMAECFSSSILPCLEKQDIDMLYWAEARGNIFNLKVTNEALETHVIRYADLLVFPKGNKERIFAADNGKFYKASGIISPLSCIAEEGDCLAKVMQMDHLERISLTDEDNLASQEFMEMTFDSPRNSELGLVVGTRQTFVTTYLFYQALGYLGRNAGTMAARIETGGPEMKEKANGIWNMLGGIEISVMEEGKWTTVNQIKEIGPIAPDVHMVKLPASSQNPLKVRLKMTKGLWRIDYLALARLEKAVEPVRIKPSSVIAVSTNSADNIPQLRDSLKPLITLPGDSYKLLYELPANYENCEIFLCSKGYYIEWMRESWLEETDLRKASSMIGFPKAYLKRVAPDFKKMEATMEENFWNSRYVKKD